MLYKTINTGEAIGLFGDLMRPDSQTRILRLLGDTKLGKSHLLTKVFPMLAQQKSLAHWVVLDLRNSSDEVPDILHLACSQIGPQGCSNYETADQTWTNRPKVDINRLFAIFSSVSVSAKDSPGKTRQRDRYLTTQFVRDMGKLTNILLLFDSVDRATEYMQMWLMNSLLIQLSSLAHVRVVVAGSSLPEAHVSYVALCRSYRLLPVTEAEEYINFCQSMNIPLSEQSIRDIAYILNHSPGLFAEFVVSKDFGQRKILYG